MRDGFFTMQDSGIVVRSCDLGNMWARFLILLVVKPIASLIARKIISVKMRKTLLGKKTIHGTSKLAAEIVASRRVVKSGTSEAETDAKLHAKFNLVEEELEAVRSELSLASLKYKVRNHRRVTTCSHHPM